jgi:glycosyltransferase involved in cell wall biosynthesis
MQILHVYKDYFPVFGGIENHIKMLAEGQAARGHMVSVLVTSRDRHSHIETLGGVRLIFAARLATISSAPISLALFRYLASERSDIVHLHYPYPWGELASYFFGHSVKTVLTFHSDIVRQKYLRLLYSPLMQRVLERVDTIIATSPDYIATSPVLARWQKKCVVVPLGIDPSPYSNSPLDPLYSTSLREWSRQDGDRQYEGVILFVGHLRYYKGLNYLLQALHELPGTRLIVVGRGPMDREWKNLARELGVERRVDFVGEIANADLPSYYTACDVFVLPSSERSEAFGVVQLEAMAAGKPVVSCDVGTGVGWVNQNEVTGLVVPPRDPAALANAIKRILSDKELAERMGIAGRERVRAEFTIGNMVDQVMRVYENAISASPHHNGKSV